MQKHFLLDANWWKYVNDFPDKPWNMRYLKTYMIYELTWNNWNKFLAITSSKTF